MKKIIYIFSILQLFAISLSAQVKDLSQLSNTQCYHIAKLPLASYGYIYYDSANPSYAMSAQSATVGTGDAYEWAIYQSQQTGAYYLFNVSAQKFLTTDGTFCPLSASASPVTFTASAQAGEWFVRNVDNLVGMTSEASNTLFFQDELSSANTSQITMEPSTRTLSSAELQTLQNAVASYEQPTSVKVIGSIGSALTSLSNLTDGSTVLLYNYQQKKYTYENQSNNELLFNATAPALNKYAGMDYVFTVNKNASGAYSFKAKSGKYIPAPGGSYIYTSSSSSSFTITASTTANCWNIQSTSNSQYLNGWSNAPVGWNASEGNSRYVFYPVTLVDATDIYPISYVCSTTINGQYVDLGTRTIFKDGNTIEAPVLSGFTLSSTSKTGVVTAATTVDAVYTSNAVVPFTVTTISAGNFADNTTWYRIKVGGRYLRYIPNAASYKLTETDVPTMENTDLWCFVGDVVNGFRLYNRAAGTAYPLTCDNVGVDNYPSIADGTTTWMAQVNGSVSTSYSLRMNGKNYYLCLSGNYLQVSTNNNASASCLFEAVKDTMEDKAILYYSSMGNYVGGYAKSDLISALYTHALTDNTTPSETNFEALRTAYNAFILSGQKPIAIQSDRLYVLRNVGRDNSPAAYGTSTTGYWKTYSDTDLSMMWRFQPTSTANQYYLLNPSFGTYLGETKSGNNTVLETTASHTYTLSQVSGSLIKWFICNDNSSGGNYRYVHAQVSGSALVGWVSGTDVLGSQWYIVPVTTFPVNIASEAMPYGSLCLPFAVTLPTGLSAYSGTDKGTYVQLDDYLTAGSVLPASTPVVLKGAAGSYTVTYTEDKGTAPASNAFLGTVARTAKPSTGCYVLGFIDNTPGFYNYTADYLPAFKVFLSKASDGTSAKALSLGTPTDITGPSVPTTTTAPTYDLQGRRVLHPQKGVYINGGKKIIIK
jgi:hypothetical protein